jgi:hypothetical protein
VTGIRLAEAIGLNLDSVTGRSGARRLQVTGKGNKDRANPIEPSLEARLDRSVRRAFTNAQGVVLRLKVRHARAVVRAAGTVGAAPIPVSDAVVLVPIQVGMLAGSSAIFGVDVTRGRIAELIQGLANGASGTPVSRSEASQSLAIAPLIPTRRKIGLRTGGPLLIHTGP